MLSRRKFIQAGSLLTLPLLLDNRLLNADNKYLKDKREAPSNQNWNFLSKISYGPKKETLEKLAKKGYKKYLEEQLSPPKEDSPEIKRRLSELQLDIKYEYNGYQVDEKRNLSFLDKSLSECRKEYEKVKEKGWFEWIRPAMEVASANWIRAVYSEWQLKEMMVEFWHNHFNVTVNADMALGSCMPAYDRDVIRKNVFGNFRVFLEDIAKSPAMLYYLNNKSSQSGPANENYARELFELHTMGEQHYFNNLYDKWKDVPGALEGKPIGYIDEDIYEAARAFTGWTIADGTANWRGGQKEEFANTGEFFYFDGWHDNYQKRVLAFEIKSNQPPMSDGQKVLDLLAAHPGTAKHLCSKLLLRFVGDTYPDSLLQKAQDTWLKNIESPDQIKLTLQTILESEEFINLRSGKVKRPYEYIVSVARQTNAEFTPNMMLHWVVSGMGYKPFMWPAPTGHPDKDTYWMGPGAMIRIWKMSSTIIWWKGFGVFTFNFSANTPPNTSYEQIVDHWSEKIISKKLADKYRMEVVNIFAGGKPPQSVPDLSDPATETSLFILVEFLIASPDFQKR